MDKKQQFLTAFQVPSIAVTVIDEIVTPAEQALVAGTAPDTPFDTRSGFGAAFLEAAYRRGVLSQTADGRFVIGSFYTRLDVFVVTEQERYRTFAPETRRALDAWYFDTYYAGLRIAPDAAATEDAVLTLDETLARVTRETRQAYLTNCDCRSLAAVDNHCGKPRLTCISYRNGPNTFAHRGVSKPISKETALETVREADRAGLMHTANADAICNCCADCCYLSRARARRNAELAARFSAWLPWPRISARVRRDPERCSSCGVCVKRCPFGLFRENGGDITLDSSACAGCGLCVNTCPADALRLE